jgi:hypothetical protein
MVVRTHRVELAVAAPIWVGMPNPRRNALAASSSLQNRSMIRDVEVRDAGSKGKGVFALRGFRRGEFIFRRRNGRVVTGDEIAIVLPPGCYLNHSCEPNAMRSGVKVFAWRDIPACAEIAIDCRLNAFDGECWPVLADSRAARAGASAASSRWTRGDSSPTSPTLRTSSARNGAGVEPLPRRPGASPARRGV